MALPHLSSVKVDNIPALIGASGRLPRSYIFQTRQGALGVLWITALAAKDRSPHIRITYRLFRLAGGAAHQAGEGMRPGLSTPSTISGQANAGKATAPATQPAEPEEPGDEMVASVYDLRDLLATPDANAPEPSTRPAATTQPAKWPSSDKLIAFIKTNVDPNSWEPAGKGNIRDLNRQILIRQTLKNQVAVRALIWEQRERLAGRQVKMGHLLGQRFPLRFATDIEVGRASTKCSPRPTRPR